jgi:hypothetical protein
MCCSVRAHSPVDELVIQPEGQNEVHKLLLQLESGIFIWAGVEDRDGINRLTIHLVEL